MNWQWRVPVGWEWLAVLGQLGIVAAIVLFGLSLTGWIALVAIPLGIGWVLESRFRADGDRRS